MFMMPISSDTWMVLLSTQGLHHEAYNSWAVIIIKPNRMVVTTQIASFFNQEMMHKLWLR